MLCAGKFDRNRHDDVRLTQGRRQICEIGCYISANMKLLAGGFLSKSAFPKSAGQACICFSIMCLICRLFHRQTRFPPPYN